MNRLAAVQAKKEAKKKSSPQTVLHLRGRTTCPNCEHEGPIESDFGIRVMRGEVYAQSWCRDCRADPDRKEAKAKRH